MKFELLILGSNSAIPSNNRHPSAQILNIQEHHFLIDCGEGTQMRMNENRVRRNKIKQIFISHLHGDHYFGLIGLLTSFALNQRKTPIDIFSPPGLEEIIRVQMKHMGGGFSYPLTFHELSTDSFSKIFENPVLEVFSFPLVHRIPTVGYLFKEKPRPRSIRSEKIGEYSIHYSDIPGIKSGADFRLENGEVISNEELTTAPKSPKSYAYCSDTLYSEKILKFIKEVDMLYHESTFCMDKLPEAEASKHSTAHQAATIAAKANAGKLIIGHFSSRYRDLTPFGEEAKAIFPNSEVSQEGMRYSLD